MPDYYCCCWQSLCNAIICGLYVCYLYLFAWIKDHLLIVLLVSTCIDRHWQHYSACDRRSSVTTKFTAYAYRDLHSISLQTNYNDNVMTPVNILVYTLLYLTWIATPTTITTTLPPFTCGEHRVRPLCHGVINLWLLIVMIPQEYSIQMT